MSAVFGLYGLDNRSIDSVLLARMMESLSHRKCDDSGVWDGGYVGLAHQMLWTTPESLIEKLPLVSHSNNTVITADARIDNRTELIEHLGLRNLPQEKVTDSYLILAAYRKWEEQCPAYLLGDFAFAIWDSQQQKLFCARDHFGIKPFYYYHHPGYLFAFSTEIKAILSLPDVPCRPNELRIAYYLASIIPDKAITFYEEVYRLPPSHSLVITATDFRLKCYWELDPHREIQYGSDEEYELAFREIFTEAVRCRLRSAFPIGFTLSGGLDSSSVTCTARHVMAEQGKLPLNTFSTIYEATPECDERPYIRSIVEQGGIEPFFITADDWSVFHDIQRSIQQQGQPLEIRNQFMWQAMYGAAQQKGIRVMLDGEDGDTVVSYGQGYLAELAIAGRWGQFYREAIGLAQHFNNHDTSAHFYLENYGFPYLAEMAQAGQWLTFAQSVSEIATHFNLSQRTIWLHQGLKPIVPALLRQAWRRWCRFSQTTFSIYPLLHPDLVERVNLVNQANTLQQRYNSLNRTHREGHLLALTADGTSWIEEESDCTAAAFGIEKRHPFWDRRMVEFCLALPPEQLLRDGWTRLILRRAMAGVLPETVQWRVGKSNLGANFVRSLMTFERDRLQKTIIERPQNIAFYVNEEYLRKVYERFQSKPTVAGAEIMWKTVNLAVWLSNASAPKNFRT